MVWKIIQVTLLVMVVVLFVMLLASMWVDVDELSMEQKEMVGMVGGVVVKSIFTLLGIGFVVGCIWMTIEMDRDMRDW